MRFQVRFHVGNRQHYWYWRNKSAAGVRDHAPATVSLTLLDFQLRDHRWTADRIHGNAHKRGCVCVDCNEALAEASREGQLGLPHS